MLRIDRKTIFCVALVVMAISASAFAGPVSVTIASFADPSIGASEPLFTINYDTHRINGSWSGTGMTLEVPVAGLTYENATFVMDELVIPDNPSELGYYTTNGGSEIRFFAEGIEVMKIEFNKMWVEGRDSGLDADDAYSDGVTISGIGIGVLKEESFGFTFANTESNGVFNATASFTSSAVPEPATMAILALGGLMLRRRRK